MVSDSTRPSFSPFQAQAELELLQLILQEDETPYPWSPTEPGAYAYFEALEQEVVAAGWSADELAPYTQALSHQFDQMWATLQTETAPKPSSLFNTDLFQRFTARMPQNLLNNLVEQARGVIASNLAMADQLVLCVQEILPEWGEEDLHILARPFAHAMRSGSESDLLETALKSVRCADWEELSSIEQARLSLAIARYTIAQLPNESVDQ